MSVLCDQPHYWDQYTSVDPFFWVVMFGVMIVFLVMACK